MSVFLCALPSAPNRISAFIVFVVDNYVCSIKKYYKKVNKINLFIEFGARVNFNCPLVFYSIFCIYDNKDN